MLLRRIHTIIYTVQLLNAWHLPHQAYFHSVDVQRAIVSVFEQSCDLLKKYLEGVKCFDEFSVKGAGRGTPITRVTTITSTDTMLLIFFGLSLNPAVPSCWWSSPSPVGCKMKYHIVSKMKYHIVSKMTIKFRVEGKLFNNAFFNYCNVLNLPSPWTDFERLLETNTDTAT